MPIAARTCSANSSSSITSLLGLAPDSERAATEIVYDAILTADGAPALPAGPATLEVVVDRQGSFAYGTIVVPAGAGDTGALVDEINAAFRLSRRWD